MTNKFWKIEAIGDQSAKVDFYGYVGGSKEDGSGFNEQEFLADFRRIPPTSKLDISINSFGGSLFTGLSIYTLLKTHKGEITFTVNGAAMSAASVITSVPNARVVMPKGSVMMIHGPMSTAYGNAREIEKTRAMLEKLEEQIVEIYAEKTNRPVDEVRKAVEEETYFTAEEAVSFGLADAIDEDVTVENRVSGEVVSLNGLTCDASVIARAPQGFFPTELKGSSVTEKEDPAMDLEKLKAEFPELVQAIREEGAQAERTRLADIEAIALPGHEELVRAAKFEKFMTAAELAIEIVKAEKATTGRKMQQMVADASVLEGIESDTINPAGCVNDQTDRARDFISAGAKAFARK